MKAVAGFFLLVLVSQLDIARPQDAAAPTIEQRSNVIETSGDEPLEEIIVYGEAPLLFLRGEVHRAEDVYFDLFNSMNSTDEFDIRCGWEASTGTRIRQRVCRAKFFEEMEREAARLWQIGAVPSPQAWLMSQTAQIEFKATQLEDEMRTLVMAQPALLDALNQFDEAKDAYESERERRCAGRILICRR